MTNHYHEIIFYYTEAFQQSGNVTTASRRISFFVNSEAMFNNNEVRTNIEYEIKNDPSYTSSSADYSGIIKIEWFYEN